MAKGIIVVDDIPVICAECNFANLTQNKKYFRCDVNGKIAYNAKPDWCPIKEIPERKALTGDVSNTTKMGEELVRVGFNACLDEIEGKM